MNKGLILEDVSSPFGAPYGRRNIEPEPGTLWPRLHLQRLQMEDQDYDVGGAYWGGGLCAAGSMYVAFSKHSGRPRPAYMRVEQVQIFVRAKTRAEAKAKVLAINKEARFYR